jgi:hypothetical protein
MGVAREIKRIITLLQGQWYDWTRNVDTNGWGYLTSLTVVGTGKAGNDYLPVRPARAREFLKDLPIKNHSDYTFIDVGSGKGRMLFLAAELPFQSIEGVEFARELHEAATENIVRYRRKHANCPPIRSVNVDAIDYAFPSNNLIICMYNPFGAHVFKKFLPTLNAAINRPGRHLVVALVDPECAELVERETALEAHKKHPRYHIYQNRPVAGASRQAFGD